MTERTRSGQPSRDRRSRRRWFTIFLVLGLLIVIPEIGLRLVTLFAPPSAELQAFREIGDAYPALDELVHDRNALRFDYHDYYLYAPRETTSGTVVVQGKSDFRGM